MLIGELSRTCNCPVETIRYYERIGLLPPADRRPNGYRTYDETHASLLRFIVRARHLGFGQEEIRRLTQLAQRGPKACCNVFGMVDRQYDEVRRKITELQKIENALLRLRQQCRNGSLAECPVLEELMR